MDQLAAVINEITKEHMNMYNYNNVEAGGYLTAKYIMTCYQITLIRLNIQDSLSSLPNN